jgi:hypothetical protein
MPNPVTPEQIQSLCDLHSMSATLYEYPLGYTVVPNDRFESRAFWLPEDASIQEWITNVLHFSKLWESK